MILFFLIFFLIFFLLLFICLSIYYYILNRRLQSEISQIEDSLEISLSGNLHHRILVQPNAQTKNICFLINKLCCNYQNDISLLKKSEKKYKDLMINLSHDVRTPLASMLGHLELLTSSPDITPSNNLSASLDVINRKALELANFVEMLFQWTKLDANEEKLFLSPFDINEQSRIIISKWLHIFEKNSIKYKFAIPEKAFICIIDPVAYQRIIDNLFKNIVNHSHASQMQFSVSTFNSSIHISIEDNGKGIDAKILPMLFTGQISHREGETYDNKRSMGIGLSVCKSIIDAHRGKVWAENKIDGGAKISFTLPLEEEEQNGD